MDTKSIAKILRDFGKDYAAAAKWVEEQTVQAWADATNHYQPDIDCADTVVKLFRSYDEEGALSPSEMLHKVREELKSLGVGLSEEIDRAERAESDLSAAREQLAEMRQQDREAIGLLDAVVDLYGALADSVGIYGPTPKAVDDAHRLIRESCLSAAPAGGRDASVD